MRTCTWNLEAEGKVQLKTWMKARFHKIIMNFCTSIRFMSGDYTNTA